MDEQCNEVAEEANKHGSVNGEGECDRDQHEGKNDEVGAGIRDQFAQRRAELDANEDEDTCSGMDGHKADEWSEDITGQHQQPADKGRQTCSSTNSNANGAFNARLLTLWPHHPPIGRVRFVALCRSP